MRLAWALAKVFMTIIVAFVSYVALKFEWFVLTTSIGQLTLGLLLWAAVVWLFLIILWLLYAVLMVS